MKITNQELWLEMYKAAERIRDLQPWNWLHEDDLVAIVNPIDKNEMCFCSIMGSGGEFTGLALYRGWRGFDALQNLRGAAEEGDEQNARIYSHLQDCWMIEFTNADMMNKPAKETVKQLGLKYRGAGQWIDITERNPSYLPWYVEEEDVPFITLCINHFFEVAIKAEDDNSFLNVPNPDYTEIEDEDEDDEDLSSIFESEIMTLKRVPISQKDGKWEWKDEYFDPYNEIKYPRVADKIIPSIQAAALAKKLPKREAAIMAGISMLSSVIQENKREAPAVTSINVFIQYGSGLILGQDIGTIAQIKSKFEKMMLNLFEEMKFIPSQIVVNSQLHLDWLESYEELFDLEIIFAPNDENFEEVFSSFRIFGL
jgi:hypothetical protein